MSLDVEKIKKRVKKAIEKAPAAVTVSRREKNEYEEPVGEPVEICNIDGLYHKGNTSINIVVSEGGIVTANKKELLMVVFDEDAQLIKEGDFLIYKGNEYTIQDLGNSLDIYLDMLIERA